MVFRPFIFQILTLTLFSAFFTGSLHGQDVSKCNSARLVKEFLDEHHVGPQQQGDFSQAVIKSLVLSLDANGLYFTQDDLEGPLASLQKLEESIEADQCGYLDDLKNFLEDRLSHLDTLISAIQFEAVSVTGTYQSRINSISALSTDLAALETRWGLYLKRQLYDRKYLQSSAQVLEADNLPALFEAVVADERCKLSKKLSLLKDNEDFVPKAFYSAMARSYDPHTNFYRYGFMELFMAFMNEDKPSFGFQLVENRFGQISIGKLLPGGPAWRSNQLHVGDIITTIGKSDGTEVDLSCTRLEEVERVMAYSGKSIDLTVIDATREEKIVTLVKEKVAPNVNAVRGYLLGGEKKVGYISLPDFYTNEGEEEEERGCARDVAREIIKLNNDGIEGLIIDVRNNRGGSLQEALNLIGIFIEKGPLALMQKEGAIQVLGDRNSGAAYFGPLIILVNGQSASASELLAASLQDYNRALIVGDTTFGKAVGQVMEVMRKKFREGDDASLKSGMIRYTSSRLFRLKGQSYQQQGVVPDIYVPELLVNSTRSEADYPFAINREQVDRDTYFKAYPELPLAALRERNQQRLAESGILEAKALTDSIRMVRGQLGSLNAEDFLSVRKLTERKQAWLDREFNDSNRLFKADNHSFDRMIINMSEQKKQIESMTLTKLENNLYIRQAFLIMNDLINSTK